MTFGSIDLIKFHTENLYMNKIYKKKREHLPLSLELEFSVKFQTINDPIETTNELN